jgi:PAS domain-containing protein
MHPLLKFVLKGKFYKEGQEDIRQLILQQVIFLACVFFGTYTALLRYIEGQINQASAVAIFTCFILGVATFLFSTNNYHRVGHVLIPASGIYCLYLLVNSSFDDANIFLSLLLPIGAYYLLGVKAGTIYSLLFAVLHLILHLWGYSPLVDHPWYFRTFLMVYVIIFLGTLTYEWIRQAQLDELQKQKVTLQHHQKQLSDVLNSVGQGIITFNRDLTINPHYSLQASVFFNVKNPSKVSMRQLLNLHQQELIHFDDWVEKVFRDYDSVPWHDLEKSSPVRKVEQEVNGKLQTLHLQYRPVELKSRLRSIMILAEDITDELNSWKQVRLSQKEHLSSYQRTEAILRVGRPAIRSLIDSGTGLLNRLMKIEVHAPKAEEWTQIFAVAEELYQSGVTYKLEPLEFFSEQLLVNLKKESFKEPSSEQFSEWEVNLGMLRGELFKLEDAFQTLHEAKSDS